MTKAYTHAIILSLVEEKVINVDYIGLLTPIVSKLFDRFFPDPAVEAKNKVDMFTAALNADLQPILAQLAINKEEASSGSLFLAGWRPLVGWACGAAFIFQTLLVPLIVFTASMFGKTIPLPPIDYQLMISVLSGMMGIGFGGLRTYEKMQGIDTSRLNKRVR